MSFIESLVSGGASQLVDSVGNVLDKVVTTKGDKMQLENELKKADNDYQVEMAKLSLSEQQAVYGDIDSARKMDTAVQTSANASPLSKNTSPILALGTTLITFVLFYILMFDNKNLEEKNKDIILYVLGVLSAILSQIFSFYFGSSQGSQAKNALIEKMHDQSQAPGK